MRFGDRDSAFAFHPGAAGLLQCHFSCIGWVSLAQRGPCSLQLSLEETTGGPILGDDSIVESLLPGNNKNERF